MKIDGDIITQSRTFVKGRARIFLERHGTEPDALPAHLKKTHPALTSEARSGIINRERQQKRHSEGGNEMKNGYRRLVLLAAALLLLCGCVARRQTEQPEEPTPQEQLMERLAEDELCAIAYAGYDSADELQPYIDAYLDGVTPPTCYCSAGEAWLLIPRPGTSVQLYRNDFETYPERSSVYCELLYEDSSGNPLILRCNASDIFPDATIVLTYQGKTVELTPYISLRDGSIQVGRAACLLNP